ncbi:flagellar motor switch protein FliN [Alcaligenes endophyticus]|uniref:Flagellar motor switch protein FliN n=1 Tax=Alcaligenes endophyticus TaxID=1929088 RepID=A0ABT8EL98_9BURK|nr:flagellar motor switch protein FliN [Alcaligenes endophyticus]MCX5590567.1 flagellar motor switch protein FliN [Alcaligenes endophyticus]MDN4122069.1 flagellar motor switch protein FliN [Alcaligenes endophyticus]
MTDPQIPNDDQHTPAEDDWAAALAEQAAGEQQTPHSNQAQGLGQNADDDWASALAEQAAASGSSVEPASNLFQPIRSAPTVSGSDIDMIMDIPVQLSVELGRTRLTIKNILQLGQGSVVELDGLAGEPLDIYVNGYLIAQGEVVVVDEKYGVRVTDIITPSDRIQRLNSRR